MPCGYSNATNLPDAVWPQRGTEVGAARTGNTEPVEPATVPVSRNTTTHIQFYIVFPTN